MSRDTLLPDPSEEGGRALGETLLIDADADAGADASVEEGGCRPRGMLLNILVEEGGHTSEETLLTNAA